MHHSLELELWLRLGLDTSWTDIDTKQYSDLFIWFSYKVYRESPY